jgi:hypothetical protein
LRKPPTALSGVEKANVMVSATPKVRVESLTPAMTKALFQTPFEAKLIAIGVGKDRRALVNGVAG